MTTDVNLDELKETDFSSDCVGCGMALGMKLLLQTLENMVIINATETPINTTKSSVINAGLNAAAVARGLARSTDLTVVVFAGDGTTSTHLNSLINSKENVIYICANDRGYSCFDRKLEKTFTKQLAGTTPYMATASVSHPEDFITKLKKAAATRGFKFIDLLCPSPEFWEYEPSNTVEVGRVAVETGIWPLYEVENGSVNLTKRPNRLEPVENFNHVQKKFAIKQENVDAVQNRINRNWKKLTDGRLL